jgi:acyl-CoA synthetase (NDP forming)
MELRNPKKTSELLAKVAKEGRKNLLEIEAKAICTEYDIPVTQFKLAKNQSEAIDFSKKIGFPIVLKIASPDITHKSDVGGVKIDLQNSEQVKTAYKQIMANVARQNSQARIWGILVQEMAPQSTEIIIGAVKDMQFGPAIMFGLGGIFVEVLKDVSFRIAPISREEACEMICEVKAYPLLKGYRNMPEVDIEAIVKILMDASRMVTEHLEIKELDLNPIMVYEHGAKAVDARIILE